jgi:BirA family transcriptional regulator, biotin operon repressor / biotin---[acetyl-CoA-carboxylase] ligase
MVVHAAFQTQGRGQMGSSWEAKANENLTFSVHLEPQHWNLTSPWQLSMWVSVSLARTVQHFLPEELVEIKWPNDILINQKKVAGILVENSFRGDQWTGSTVGIGWNILQMNFPSHYSATSMKMVNAQESNPIIYLSRFLEHWESESQSHIQRPYLERLWRKDQWQSIRMEQDERRGCIRNVDENGRLVVELEDGRVESYGLKELQFLR